MLEPRLVDLALSMQGGKPIVKGNIGLQEYQPLFYMGEGINKLLTSVLAIASYPGGAVLVDEIENGFHHSVLSGIWRVIIEAAQRHDTQLFISTHSYECMQAAHEASAEFDEPPCAFYRLERLEDEIFTIALSPDTLEIAFEQDLEIR